MGFWDSNIGYRHLRIIFSRIFLIIREEADGSIRVGEVSRV
jgi:hypothetical protein